MFDFTIVFRAKNYQWNVYNVFIKTHSAANHFAGIINHIQFYHRISHESVMTEPVSFHSIVLTFLFSLEALEDFDWSWENVFANRLNQSSVLRKHLIEELNYQMNKFIFTVRVAKPQLFLIIINIAALFLLNSTVAFIASN